MHLIEKIEDEFDKLEDKFLDLPWVKDTKVEDDYFKLYRLKNTIKDVLWSRPNNFLHNVVLYRKFLWYNKWFDYYYLFSVLQLKLEKDASFYRRDGCTMEADKSVDEMDRCVALIKRININRYENHNQLTKNVDNLFKYINI